jgi:GNAT superfamily N-acetyltransferase
MSPPGGPAVRLRAARPDEAEALTALALRSKAHWGYPADFLEACRDELTVTPAACGEVVVAEAGAVLGFAQLAGAGERVELVALFVEPAAIGTGVGRVLFDDACARTRARGAVVLWWDADPHAEEIYRRLGGVTVGRAPSGSVPGRTLPRMELAL